MTGAHGHLNDETCEWLRPRYDFRNMATQTPAARPAKQRGPLIPRYMWAVVVLVVIGVIIALLTGSGGTKKAQPAMVAVANVASLPVYSAPDGKITSQLPNPDPKNYGAKQVFLVLQDKGDWLKVSLPVPPNGQSGWIRTSQIILAKNYYRVDVARGAHQVRIYEKDKLIKTYPVGIGTKETPTPGGTYFIRVLIKNPNPTDAYGPYAYGLSGFSPVLTQYNGGDGVIGMHGTNEPQAIGTDVSHGCIRLSNANITDLATRIKLPLGTPVRILA
jgi:lipoprotein-anchoring transpeptidase ErfK/SrfK